MRPLLAKMSWKYRRKAVSAAALFRKKTCKSLITLPLIPISIIPRSNFVPILIRHGRRLHSPSTPWDFRADSRTQSNNWEQTGRT